MEEMRQACYRFGRTTNLHTEVAHRDVVQHISLANIVGLLRMFVGEIQVH